MHKFDPGHMAHLEGRERKELFNPGQALLDLGLQPGMAAADIGCGTGFFSRQMSAIVGADGKIYALDISRKMLAELRRRIQQEGIKNVAGVKSEENKIPLRDGSINFCLLSFVVHELSEPQKFFKEIKRILAPGGIIGIIEWKKVESPLGPPPEERIDEDEMRRLLIENGVEVNKAKSLGPCNYLMAARKTW